MPPTAPLFDRYEVIRRLAVGGMGEIFLARQTGMAGFQRLVILKTLLPDLADQDVFLTQFLDEACVAATLNHPNIVGIYEIGEFQGTYFIAMEYVHGVDTDRLSLLTRRAGRRLPVRVIADVIRGAALGLDYAHHARDATGQPLCLVHRDISPQNIMVRDDGVVKVVDFGVAKAANRLTRTQGNLVKGKPRYMSPEQVRAKEIDGRSDQFSLGVVMWELLTGAVLFEAENLVDTAGQIVNQPIPRVRDRAPECPEELDAVVARMLSRRAQDRFPRCRDVAIALQSYLEATGGDAAGEVSSFVGEIAGEIITRRTANLTPETLPISQRARRQIQCPSCGANQRPRARFCADCGTRLQASPPPLPRPAQRPADVAAAPPAEISDDSQPTRPLTRPQLMGVDNEAAVEIPLVDTPPPEPVHLQLDIRPEQWNRDGRESLPFDSPSVATSELAALIDDALQETPSLSVVRGSLLTSDALRPVHGRTAALQRIECALSEAQKGGGHAVILEGAAGLGKTRLLQEAAQLAITRRFTLGWALAPRYGEPVAFDVFRQCFMTLAQVLRPPRAGVDTQDGLRFGDVMAALVATRVPAADLDTVRELLDGGGRQNLTAEAAADAIAGVLRSLATHAPLCLLLDDMHAADPDSLRLLPLVLERIKGAGVAVLLATTSEGLPREEWPCVRCVLDDLEDEALTAAVETLLGKPLGLTAARLLRERAHGNLLLAREQAAVLRADGLLVLEHDHHELRGEGAAVRLPRSIAEATAWRLERLEPGARMLVQMAALMGHVVNLDLLSAATGIGAEVHAHVRQCEEEGLLLRLPAAQTLLRFTHESMRTHARASIPPDELKAMLLSAAQAYERRVVPARGEMVEMASQLFLRAGAAEKALHYSGIAAQRLVRQGASATAVELVRQTVDQGVMQVEEQPGRAAAMAPRVLRLAVRCAEWVEPLDVESAVRILQGALQRLPCQDAVNERVHAACALARLLCRHARFDDAVSALNDQLETLRRDGDGGLFAEVLAELGMVAESRGDTLEAATWLMRALHLMASDETASREAYRNRLEQLSRLHLKLGATDRAHRTLQHARQCDRLAGPALLEVLAREGLMDPPAAVPSAGAAG